MLSPRVTGAVDTFLIGPHESTPGLFTTCAESPLVFEPLLHERAMSAMVAIAPSRRPTVSSRMSIVVSLVEVHCTARHRMTTDDCLLRQLAHSLNEWTELVIGSAPKREHGARPTPPVDSRRCKFGPQRHRANERRRHNQIV